MRQGARTLLHLVNLSGHSQTAWFDPVPFPSVRISLQGRFTQARAHRANRDLTLRYDQGRTEFTLPLAGYELVELAVTQ
jgi:hypothetical protein